MKCWVFCAEQETSRERGEMKRIFWHTIRLTLSHRCGTRNECNVMCGQSVLICTCCVRRVTVHTPRRLPGNCKLPASEKQLPEQEKMVSESLHAAVLPVLMISSPKFFTVQSRLKIANNPDFDSTSNHRASAIARMKTNLLKDNISIQFEGEPYSCTPRIL